MTDSSATLNFGPEWLKKMGGNSVTSPPPPTSAAPSVSAPSARYRAAENKAAENRYGREEVLSLFTANTTPPDDLLADGGFIVVEKTQHPLVFKAMSETEQVCELIDRVYIEGESYSCLNVPPTVHRCR